MIDGIEFLKEVKAGKLARSFFFFGDEDYLMDVAVDRVVERLGAEKRVYYGDETDPTSVFQEGGRLELFGTARPIVTVVKHVQLMRDWAKGFKKAGDHRGTVILVADSVEELSRRWFKSSYPLRPSAIEKNLKKYLPENTVYVHFPLLDRQSNIFKQWLKRELDKRGLHINRMLWQKFVEALPMGMRAILNELDKIALYFGGDGEITEGVISRFLTPTPEAEGLALANMIVDGDAKALMETVDELIRSGVYPGQIIGLTAGSFSKMLQLKSGAKRVRLPYGLAEKYRRFVANKRVYELMSVFEKFAQADMASKTYPQSPQILMKKVFLEILMEISSPNNSRRNKK